MKSTIQSPAAFLYAVMVLILLSIICSCSTKEDPYPPLREISAKIYCDSCEYEIKTDNYSQTGNIIGYDSLTVSTEHIEKGQHWELNLVKKSAWDSTIIYVNTLVIRADLTLTSTGKTFSFNIIN